ncbi:hypothetical protein GCM10023149_09550 [Mucilaginibacter gynuensis]|uniref:HTH marR-type domain-containing protein n=1 Tax=Mucilaginibacter gynuensis TaxID=1302236 RepID=A0ABP8FYQ3_9SPHI
MSVSTDQLTEQFSKAVSKLNMAFRQFIQARLRQYEIDLTFEMLQVMICLWQKDGINQQEIANITVKDKASMVYLLDNLEKRSLVYRMPDMSDRRNKLIFLTKKGKGLERDIQPILQQMYDSAEVGIKPAKLKEFICLCENMWQNLENGMLCTGDEISNLNKTP